MTPDRFVGWLERSKAFQTETYGTPLDELQGKPWAEYIRTSFLAAHTELSEALQNLNWKPWRGGEYRPYGADQILATEELVDVLFFLSNILVAIGVTDEDLNREYERKAAVNRKRQEVQNEAIQS